MNDTFEEISARRAASWIPHSASTLGEQEAQAASAAAVRNFVGYGPSSAELERQFCALTGRKYAFAVTSGAQALLLGLSALDLPPSALVSIPVLTCASVLIAARQAGHRVWLADIEDRLTIDASTVHPESQAVVAPHAYGAPVDVDAVGGLGLPWIEDCATSPATIVGGKPAGASGTIAIFSLGSTKYITGGGGGMLLTDDDQIAVRVRDLLDFDDGEKQGAWSGAVPAVLPGRLPDLNAAVALVQLGRLREFADRRKRIATIYRDHLSHSPTLRLADSDGHSYYRYIVWSERELAATLRERGIDARSSVNPWLNHLHYDGVLGGPWPVADSWRNHLLSLPIHPQMSDADAQFIAEILLELLD